MPSVPDATLDPTDVDALLAAMEGGSYAPPSAVPEPARATQRPSDPLFFGPSAKPGGRAPEVLLYDFKRPERVSKDQMRSLEALHEGFGRNFGASLSGYLRTIVEVGVAHLEQLTYSEFIYSLPNPTCFHLLKNERLDGQLCLEMSPLIIYPIIDRLLGGSSAELFIPQRPLTAIEQRLVEKVTKRVTQYLSEAWSGLTEGAFEVADFESNPQLVQIVPPNETVVVIGFELKMGTRTGTMSLCIPYNTIEPVMGKLSQQSWLTYQRKSGGDAARARLERQVGASKVELRAVLARTTLKLSELLALTEGDVITTEKEATSALVVEVGGRPKFTARVGQLRGRKAICVDKKVT